MKKKAFIKKALWIAASTVLIFFYFMGLSLLGQYYRENNPPKKAAAEKKIFNRNWKFQKGDDPKWSAADFNDHSWSTVVSDSLPDTYHGELSWFRLHLTNDTFLLKKEIVFVINHFGASEIYLDGDKIAAFGVVSAVKEKEINFDPDMFHINVDLQKCDSHVVAIRYSNHHYKELNILSEKNNSGFTFMITDYPSVIKDTISSQFAELLGFSIGIFLLTLAFIHFLLYIFYRHAKENFYYSLFVLCYSLLFFIGVISAIATSPWTQLYLRDALLIVLNPLLFISLLAFIFWLNRERFFHVGGWLVVGIGLVAILHVLTGWPGMQIYFSTLIWQAVFCVITMGRGTVKALKEKRPGFRILTAGVGTFALFFIASLSLVFFSNHLSLELEVSNMAMIITMLIVLMSIPISMSIFLAYTSSRTNKDLQQKLSEVETLSAKSLEQEKEKQKILETQKETLEIQVKERTHEILEQNKVIEEKNKDITDSLNYAKRIQEAILPSRELKKQLFPDSFVLFKPKDIVSGDFYWYTKAESWNERHRSDGKGKRIIASVDCTGHGVPGAFMSMIGNNLLSEIVLEKGITKPSEILDLLHEGVRSSLKQNKDGSETRDGMDIALCCFDSESTTIEYAGAQRPLWIIRADNSNPVIEEIKADKFSIGGLESADRKKFSNHSVELKKGDLIYIFSDGFADQFGGKDGKKFMSKQFKDLLLSVQHLPMNEQENALEKRIEEWKGKTVQIDDILVIGIKI